MIGVLFGIVTLLIAWTMCAALGWWKAGAIAVGMWAVLWGLVHNGWLGYGVVGVVLMLGLAWLVRTAPVWEAEKEEESRRQRG